MITNMKSAFSKIAKAAGKDAEEDQEDEAENWRDYSNKIKFKLYVSSVLLWLKSTIAQVI
jgi:hypothetical protein